MAIKQRVMSGVVAAVVFGVATVGLRADDERLKTAAVVLTEMTSGAEAGISPTLLAKAKCVVVVPGVKKAALGVGGQYGRGYIACRKDAGGWGAPGGIRIEGGSVGLQIGGTETDLILLVLNARGVERLLASRFTVGADATVAAGPVGRQAAAQTDATLTAEILAWSRARGAFAGLSLQGSTLREDTGENKELYGREVPNKEIVRSDLAAPPAAAALMAVLGKL
jgi:lipid-binding SYLF domain-containing protein